jgi:hypothetical protein
LTVSHASSQGAGLDGDSHRLVMSLAAIVTDVADDVRVPPALSVAAAVSEYVPGDIPLQVYA